MMKPTIFLDLDDTLMDTPQLRRTLPPILAAAAGITVERLREIRAGIPALIDHGYSARLLLAAARGTDVSIEEIEALLEPTAAGLPHMLYPQTLPFIAALKRASYQIELLTKGDLEFQGWKIRHLAPTLSLDAYRIVTPDGDKGIFTRDNGLASPDSPPILVDDRQANVDSWLANFPHGSAYLSIADAAAALNLNLDAR